MIHTTCTFSFEVAVEYAIWSVACRECQEPSPPMLPPQVAICQKLSFAHKGYIYNGVALNLFGSLHPFQSDQLFALYYYIRSARTKTNNTTSILRTLVQVFIGSYLIKMLKLKRLLWRNKLQ